MKTIDHIITEEASDITDSVYDMLDVRDIKRAETFLEERGISKDSHCAVIAVAKSSGISLLTIANAMDIEAGILDSLSDNMQELKMQNVSNVWDLEYVHDYFPFYDHCSVVYFPKWTKKKNKHNHVKR